MSYTINRTIELLKDGKIDEALKIINTNDEIFITWGIEDIIDRAKERGIKIGKKKAREILADIEKHHDATIGINWDVIDIYI
jgi:hypothetical protein